MEEAVNGSVMSKLANKKVSDLNGHNVHMDEFHQTLLVELTMYVVVLHLSTKNEALFQHLLVEMMALFFRVPRHFLFVGHTCVNED